MRLDNPITLLTDAHSANVAGQMLLLAVERFAAACERTRLATAWHEERIAGRVASNLIECKALTKNADTDIYASGDETGTDYEGE